MGFVESVAASLADLELTPADSAAVHLARQYAIGLDNGSLDVDSVGPKLLTTLNALGATPAGRSRLKGGEKPNVSNVVNPLSVIQGGRAN